MLNCENVAIDRVIETLGVRNEEENDIQTTIIRYTPFYRLYLLTQVVTNLLTPFLFFRFITHRMYLSCLDGQGTMYLSSQQPYQIDGHYFVNWVLFTFLHELLQLSIH